MIWGIPRRVYSDRLNVRVEHWRTGEPLTQASSVCELPDHYAQGLRYAAMARCLLKPGPGQDLDLAQWYLGRYQRVQARITKRLIALARTQTPQMGGSTPRRGGPPTPALPWQYQGRVR